MSLAPTDPDVRALLAGTLVGADPAKLAQGLSEFTGVRRRFEFKGDVDGVRVYDDYAHHPTEVAATIAFALHAPRDAVLTDITVRPGPR